MPSYIGLDRVIYTSSSRGADVAAASGSFAADTSGGRYPFGPHGADLTPEAIDALLREGRTLIDVHEARGGFVVREAGRIVPGGADPALPTAGRLGDDLLVARPRAAVVDGRLILHLDLHVVAELEGDLQLVVELQDASGNVVASRVGSALAGFSPPRLWRAGDLILDAVAFPRPSPGAYHALVGLRGGDGVESMPATGAEGAVYPDGLLPVGELIVTGDGVSVAAAGR
jgi:hypothetical protein